MGKKNENTQTGISCFPTFILTKPSVPRAKIRVKSAGLSDNILSDPRHDSGFDRFSHSLVDGLWIMEARAGIEPAIRVLQTLALPLGYRATFESVAHECSALNCAKC